MIFSQMDTGEQRSLKLSVKIVRKYLFKLISSFNKNQLDINVSTLYFVCESNTWVLSRIINEIKLQYDLPCLIITSKEISQHPSGFYFFDHYLTYMKCRIRHMIPYKSSFIFFTHPRSSEYSNMELIDGLSDLLHIFCMSSIFAKDLKHAGLSEVTTIASGVSESFLNQSIPQTNITNSRPLYIISSRYYSRKNPLMYQQLVNMREDIDFLFIGKGWSDVISNTNVKCINDINYENYPALYQQANCLLSLSLVEGGPLCLLEAAACGLPIIATNTGIANDLAGYDGIRVLDEMTDISTLNRLCDEFVNYKRFSPPELLTWKDFGAAIASKSTYIIKKYQEKLAL